MTALVRSLACLTIAGVLGATPALAAPADGTYTGTISSGGTVTIVVSGGTVTSFSFGSYTSGCATITGSIGSCSTIGDNFTCGQTFCAPDGVPRMFISGTFSGASVSGEIDLSLQGPVITIPPPCCTRTDVSWSATRVGDPDDDDDDDDNDDDDTTDDDDDDDDAPPPPPGEWLASDALPGFRVKVRITTGDTDIIGGGEDVCIDETICVSGAIPGRSEVFVRVVGPKPNGFLWPTIVKFSTSRIEIWIEQLSTGQVNYYELSGASPGSSDLEGFFDRTGFSP